MPIYDFKCDTCEKKVLNRILRITHTEDELPTCCNRTMGYYITRAPMVHWIDPVIEPFRAIATKDQPVITTTRQNREYMARNGLVDANDVVCKPPSNVDQENEVAEMQQTIDEITPKGELAHEMKDRGLLDIVD